MIANYVDRLVSELLDQAADDENLAGLLALLDLAGSLVVDSADDHA